MRRYQLQGRVNSRAWFPASFEPLSWRRLLNKIRLWRDVHPDMELRAVEWKDSIR